MQKSPTCKDEKEKSEKSENGETERDDTHYDPEGVAAVDPGGGGGLLGDGRLGRGVHPAGDKLGQEYVQPVDVV